MTIKDSDSGVLAENAVSQPADLLVLAGGALAEGRNDAAFELYTAVLAQRPDDSRAVRGLAKALRGLKRLTEAAQTLTLFVKLRPDDATGHHDLGRVLASAGQHDAAIAPLHRAIELQPDRASALRDLGKSLSALKRHVEAAYVFRAHTALQPQDANGWSDLARALAAQNADAKEIVEICRRAIELDGKNVNAYREMAKSLRKLGQNHEAADAFAHVVELLPQDAAALHDHGRALASVGRHDEAVEDFRRALELNPGRVGVQPNLGKSLLILGRPIEAEAALLAYVLAFPDDASAHFDLGRAQAAQEKLEQALATLRISAELATDKGPAMREQARVLRSLKRLAEAADMLIGVAALRPKDAAPLHDRGRLLATLGRFDEAVIAFGEAQTLQPDRRQLWRDLGRALMALGRSRDAEAIFRKEAAAQASEVLPAMELGRLFNREKRWEDAVAQFRDVIDRSPAEVAAHHGLGVALRRTATADEAIESFEAALALDPQQVDSLLQVAELSHLSGNMRRLLNCTDRILAIRPDHTNARLLRAQANFEQGNIEASLADLEEALRVAPDNPKASLYRDLVKKHAAGENALPSVSICVLRPLTAQDRTLAVALEGAAEEILAGDGGDEAKADGAAFLHGIPGGWRDCLAAARSEWVLVVEGALPDPESLDAFRKRAGLKVGCVAIDPAVPGEGASLWLREPLQAWLGLDAREAADWPALSTALAPHLRVRVLQPPETPLSLQPYVAPDPTEKRPEVWLVSSSGMQLFGGVEQFLRNMVPIYRNQGFDPIIVGLLESMDGREVEGEIDGQRFLNMLRTADAVRLNALRRAPALAQGTTGIGYELAGGLEGLRTRVIYGSHFWRDMFIGTDSFENVDLNGRPRAEFTRLCATVDQGYANSRYTRDMIEKHFGVVQSLVYSLPFDVEPEPDRPPGRYVLLMNGRPDKGFNLMMYLAERLPFVAFRVIAAQVSRDRIEERIQAAGITNIEIVGWTKDIASLYRGARAVMVASYAFVETFSRVVIEAHRHGVPVIGSNRGNVPLLLEEAGISLPENSDAWVEEVRRLYLDEDYYALRCRLALENSQRYRFAEQPERVERLVRASTERVAVAIGSGIGNMVQCAPVIRRLAEYLERPVDVLMNQDFPGCGTLFAGAPWVGQVFESGSMLSKLHYDTILVLDCFGNMLPRFNADRVVITRRKFAFDLTRDMHESHFNLMCAQELLGVPFTPEDVPNYFVGSFGRGTPKPGRIGFHAGGKAGVWLAKRWPYYEELVPRLQAAGFELVSFGSKAEYIPGTVDLTGTDLRTSIQNLQSCDYFIANDSGIMHIADGIGVPLTSIFGPTSVLKNGPLAPTSQVIALEKDCAPCQFDTAKFHSCTCIRELTLEDVERRILAHMAELNINRSIKYRQQSH